MCASSNLDARPPQELERRLGADGRGCRRGCARHAEVMSFIERIEAERRSLTPETGFNVIGVDRFELPGEAAYLVSHHATRAEAEAVAKRMKRESPADAFHVYQAEPARRARVSPRR